MRARRREINIFNMSLLDILCGALGAFCFMMIVALPYYKPPGHEPDLVKAQKKTDELMQQLDQMKTQMRDAKATEDLSALLEQLKAQVRALQGQVNILTAQRDDMQRQMTQLIATNQALQAKTQSLTDANQKLQALLQAKKPFTIIARADDYSQGLDLMLFKPSALANSPNPLFESWTEGHFDRMHTVRNALLLNHGIGVMVNENSPPNSEGKLFVRLTNRPELRKKTEIEGAIAGDEDLAPPVRLPRVTLYPERYWILLGTVMFDQASQPHFTEASAEEREAAWQELTGSTPPPTPPPPPTPSDAERAKDQAERAQRQQLYKKVTTLLRIPFDPSGRNDAEILRLSDELLQELPPNDHLRREVESRREHILEMKAQRERQAAPNETASPLPKR